MSRAVALCVLSTICIALAGCTSAAVVEAELQARAEFMCPEMDGELQGGVILTSSRGRTRLRRVTVRGCGVVAVYECVTGLPSGMSCQMVSASMSSGVRRY